MARPQTSKAAQSRAAPSKGTGLMARLRAGISMTGAPPKARSQIMRDSGAGFMSAWRPALTERRDEIGGAWEVAAARVTDAVSNSGWLAGGVDQLSADTVGPGGLRLNATPDADALGISQDEASELSQKIERRFRRWASNPLECDARGTFTIAALADAAIRHHLAFGEVNALLPKIDRAASTSRVKVMMMSPARHVLDTDEATGWYQGVKLDGNGMPIAYRYRRRLAWGGEDKVDFAARARSGRPQVAHIFDGVPDQVRGISPLTPVLLRVRQYDTLAEATLTASLIQTIIAATIKSPALREQAWEGLNPDDADNPLGDEIKSHLDAKMDWAANTKLDLGAPGRIAHLFPGEEFAIHKPGTPTDTYLPYSRALLREIARCIGVTYESMTGDYDGATYSSVRMATSSIWSIVMRRRERIGTRFMQMVYEAWLDEEIDSGRIVIKGGYERFLRVRADVCAAEWHGPAKPTADDLKSAKAAGERLDRNLTSLSSEMADYGLDVETVFEQRAKETALAKKYGLADPHAPKIKGKPATVADNEDDETDDTEPAPKKVTRQ